MELLKIWEILQRRKRTFFIVFLAFISIVLILTHFVTPTYQASAKILIESNDSEFSFLTNLGVKGVVLKEGDTLSQGYYDTDITLATIEPLLAELIFELKLKDWKGSTIKPDKLANLSFIKRLKNKLFPQPYIEVSRVSKSKILEILSYSPDRFEAVNLSNKLAEMYIKDRMNRTQDEYKTIRVLLDNQIQKVRENYYNNLLEMRNFKIKDKTVDLAEETKSLITKVATLKTNYEDNEKTILETEKKLQISIEKFQEINKFRKASEMFSRSDSVKSLETRLNDALVSIARKSVEYTKEHPEYKTLEKEVGAVKQLLKDEAKMLLDSETISVDPLFDDLSKNMINAFIDREIAIHKKILLDEYINKHYDELFKIPEKALYNSKLEADLSVNKELYQALLKYLDQVRIFELMRLSNIKLVEPASLPYEIYFPKKYLNYVLGLFLALFWGLTFAFFIEYMDCTIKTPLDIKNNIPLTLLGIIPKSRYFHKYNTIKSSDYISNIIEPYRTIRNNIKYAPIKNPIKALLVTSSVDSEGKSSVASNLSMLYCKEDKKVLLVDLNLRRPSIHKFFSISGNKGITNILSEALPLEEAITHTTVKGLDLLLSGPIPLDPGKLVESQSVKHIISKLRNLYDVVIIDTPPVIAAYDAIVLGTLVDGVLYIIESGRVAISTIHPIKDMFNKAGINLIGVILNKSLTYGESYY